MPAEARWLEQRWRQHRLTCRISSRISSRVTRPITSYLSSTSTSTSTSEARADATSASHQTSTGNETQGKHWRAGGWRPLTAVAGARRAACARSEAPAKCMVVTHIHAAEVPPAHAQPTPPNAIACVAYCCLPALHTFRSSYPGISTPGFDFCCARLCSPCFHTRGAGGRQTLLEVSIEGECRVCGDALVGRRAGRRAGAGAGAGAGATVLAEWRSML